MNMADAYARVSRSLGVLHHRTGTAAGNAAGSQVEALTAGSPVLHITSQIDRPFMDRDRAAIHDVPRQADMLKAVSKAFFRVWEGRTAVGMLEAAARAALTAPRGPVSLEIPIDVQRETRPRGRAMSASARSPPQAADPQALDCLGRDGAARAKRPMLWLGGGAREATGGRARPRRARLRRRHQHQRPRRRAGGAPAHARRLQHDAGGTGDLRPRRPDDRRRLAAARQRDAQQHDAAAAAARADRRRCRAGRRATIRSTCSSTPMRRWRSTALAERLPARLDVDAKFLRRHRRRARAVRAQARGGARPLSAWSPMRCRRACAHGRHPFVRDVTLSNSTFGNRYVHLAAPHLGVHALGGGIGQGVAMAIGAALAGAPAKTIALLGDGGTMVNLGELATAVDAERRHRLRPDERPRLWRDPQHPGRAVRRPPALCRPAHAGFRAAVRGARTAAPAGVAHRGVRGGA